MCWCMHCKFEYEQHAGQDDHYCKACGSENYYVLETYYD